ncbi:MAG: galactose mutarotase [Bacteroides sp.]|nr:galactose mutarotase [Bacteroides sp.]
MKIETKTAPSPKGEITLYTLTNASGASVVLSSLGAGIVAVNVPDSNGQIDDVALGYADPADYIADGPCAGKVPGRFANRIAGGRLRVDGRDYQLAINNGPNALHGGPEGFQNQIWQSEVKDGKVVFTYVSADGEENYPGQLTATATYSWTDDCELTLHLTAQTSAATVVNLTNHCYWNLEGHSAGSILDHTLWIAASRYLPTDDTLIPTGEMAPVASTPMDFTTPKKIGRDIKADFPALVYGKGYDNCWVVDNYAKGSLRHVATLEAPASGRVLEVLTTQPAAQVYTGNWLAGSPVNKAGRPYDDYDGVAIECQAMPDSPNHADFPSTQLYPGQTYDETIIFRFKVK